MTNDELAERLLKIADFEGWLSDNEKCDLRAAAALLAREGWQLVPKEPTEAMKEAGARSIGQTMDRPNHNERSRSCWQSMLSAAPDCQRCADKRLKASERVRVALKAQRTGEEER